MIFSACGKHGFVNFYPRLFFYLATCLLYKKNTVLNNTRVKEEISREVLKYSELNKTESTTYQNLWATVKTVPRGKLTALNAYIRKEENSRIIRPSFHLRKPIKECKLISN
uniref:Uncharacterized protein n=1 Tax=Sus scrofa TaxID=9823 RepID=A0A4X1SQP8_PIG